MWDLLPRNSISSIQCQLFHLNFCDCCCSVLFSYRAKRLPTVLATTMVNSIQSPHQTHTLSRQWNKKKKKTIYKRTIVEEVIPICFNICSHPVQKGFAGHLSLTLTYAPFQGRFYHTAQGTFVWPQMKSACVTRNSQFHFTSTKPSWCLQLHSRCRRCYVFFSFFLSIPSRVYLHVFGLCSGVLFALQVNPSVGLGLLCLCSFV